MDLWLAIDFGTSNSLVAAASKDGILPPIPIDPKASDPTVFKSVLYSHRRGEWVSGIDAISMYYEWGAEGRVFKSLKKFLPDPSFAGTQVHGIFFSLEDLLARILKTIKDRAEAHLGHPAKKALLGHPALFSPQPELHKAALERLEKAARLAGFEEIRFCPEPVAAAYDFAKVLTQPKNVLIADFGGGTSDFTIIRMRPEGFHESDVLSLGGVSLAGDAFDGCIMENIVAPHFGSKTRFKMPFGSNQLHFPKALVRKMCSPADLLLLGSKEYLEFFRNVQQWVNQDDDRKAVERLEMLIEERQGYHLFQCIEEGKKTLSERALSEVSYQYGDIALAIALDRQNFQDFSQKLVETIVACLDNTVKDAGLDYKDIDLVCCTGGTARLNAMQEALSRRLGASRLQHHMPFHAVVNGLAERARSFF